MAEKLELPFVGSTIPKFLLEDDTVRDKVNSGKENFIPIDIYVKAPWE